MEKLKCIWDVLWPGLAIVLTGATTYFVYRRTKRHSEWRGYAQRIHDSFVPLHEMVGVFYAHGLEYPNSNALKGAIDLAAQERLNAMKLGKLRYRRWNQALSSAAQCHLAYRLHISGEPVGEWEVAYHSPDERTKNPMVFHNLVPAAQHNIDLSLEDMKRILGI